MSTLKRYPATRCWIKNILNGKYNSEDKSYNTIFGKIKRIRIVATIIDKREAISTQTSNEEPVTDGFDASEARLEFYLDDGTGYIRAILFKVDPERYKDFVKGDIIDVVSRVGSWNDSPQLYPEIMKKITNPNFVLLRDAEIIKKIKSGEVQEVLLPESKTKDNGEDSSEIDIEDLFEGNIPSETEKIKEKILTTIQSHSNGIGFDKLVEALNISENNLKDYIRDLEMESKIYQPEKGIYQSF